jgi:hypothetical protein
MSRGDPPRLVRLGKVWGYVLGRVDLNAKIVPLYANTSGAVGGPEKLDQFLDRGYNSLEAGVNKGTV